MSQQIIAGLFFGLGVLVQAFLFVGIKFNKDFLRRTVVNIVVGLIFVFFIAILILNHNYKFITDSTLITSIIFIISFLSHRNKMMPEEITRI